MARGTSAELLPVPYFHVVFTLPHELSVLALQNKRLLYDLLYRISATTMLELASDPKHLGANIGFLGVLHTWGQNLEHHPHVHYIVPAGYGPDPRSASASAALDATSVKTEVGPARLVPFPRSNAHKTLSVAH
jgi:hypothetical protein